MSHKLKKTI